MLLGMEGSPQYGKQYSWLHSEIHQWIILFVENQLHTWCCNLKNCKLFPPSRLFHSNQRNQNNAWATNAETTPSHHGNGRTKIKIQVLSVRYKLFIPVTLPLSLVLSQNQCRNKTTMAVAAAQQDDANSGQKWQVLQGCYFHTTSILTWSHEKDYNLPKLCFS